ncbi:MAG: hypothetical protein QGI86_15870 [Candidatus Poribacteria bacterium]|nr:hypothetical protein [Candidatus Poribacteria bacterium]MDP6751420.1 hypothetical protein [Candidatus Poribacteria bacterium]MDP6997791.1 hypothetical protein [Candidatus Poribacteria bacterium]
MAKKRIHRHHKKRNRKKLNRLCVAVCRRNDLRGKGFHRYNLSSRRYVKPNTIKSYPTDKLALTMRGVTSLDEM